MFWVSHLVLLCCVPGCLPGFGFGVVVYLLRFLLLHGAGFNDFCGVLPLWFGFRSVDFCFTRVTLDLLTAVGLV